MQATKDWHALPVIRRGARAAQAGLVSWLARYGATGDAVAADAAAAAAEAAAAATGTHAAGSSVDTLGDDEKIVAATDSSPLHWRYQLLITAAIGQLLAGTARGVGCACACEWWTCV